MVIGVFPAAKLGVLAVKQISKPIANVLKSNAKSSPFFRKYICMPPAQFYNWVEVKTKMWALNLGRPVTVPPLTEAMAIELGANLLGEFIIFAIGAGLLIFEYSRQTIKENKKNEAFQMEKMQLTNTLTEINFRLERQDAQIREMTRVLAELDSRNIFRWHKEPLPEYVPFDPNTPDQSASARNPKTYEGFYDPTGGMAFRALNFLQTQIFIDGRDRKGKQALQQIDEVAAQLEKSLEEAVSNAEVPVKLLQ
ncbi:putative OPA3-like protein CG13603 [Drosophila novamexicana]|uniref:putative OPA3-like protein CG13603 n=1 Tax=Drosophila novamexicana TaxID=47314 RepID=UPI0011E5D246|nr:putative OPA3-like protein CG13603 [Drosophila novamexicana]XP_030573264.1 putative OPA3-like protein CG13603 [Drosophila novamexicana]XP_030573265.1 putative OPA3-like protein CG13603 [Drosophila novamexicana]